MTIVPRTRRTFSIAAIAACTAAASVVAVSLDPASAVGKHGWNCTWDQSVSGVSSTRGENSTATGPLCGQAKIQVRYTVSGGGVQLTPVRIATGLVKQPGVGYDVIEGRHHVTNAAPAYNVWRTT